MKPSLLAALAAASLVLLQPLRVDAAPILSIGSYTVPATPLEPFLVPIIITDAVDVDFWQFSLTYDPTDLQINEPATFDLFGRPVTEGEFFLDHSPFNAFNPGFILLDPSDPTSQIGTLLAVNNRFGGDVQGVSGEGVVAYVEFVAMGNGSSRITVTDPFTSSVPEPATVLLIGGGLLMLGARRVSTRNRGIERN